MRAHPTTVYRLGAAVLIAGAGILEVIDSASMIALAAVLVVVPAARGCRLGAGA